MKPDSGLQGGISSATQRITVASLYIGVGGSCEIELLKGLQQAVTDTARSQLKIHVLLDALRGTRLTKDTSGDISGSFNASQAEAKDPSKIGLNAFLTTLKSQELYKNRILRGRGPKG